MKLISTINLIALTAISLSACATTSEKTDINPDADSQLIPEIEVVIPDIVVTFQEGDTLWDFSERTTGSGYNWQELKTVNQIEDEKKIDAGRELLVPFELAVESLKNQ